MINYDKGGKNMEEKETKKTLKQVKKLRRKIKNLMGKHRIPCGALRQKTAFSGGFLFDPRRERGKKMKNQWEIC